MVNTDDIYTFGHCCSCHKYLLTKRVVDGKVMDMFLPIYDETVFLLNSGSQMQISICKPCKETVNLDDPELHKNVMDAVMKGWELETKMLVEDKNNPDWNEEHGKKYLETMRKLSIDCNSEKLDRHAIQNKIIELRNLKVEEIEVINVTNNNT